MKLNSILGNESCYIFVNQIYCNLVHRAVLVIYMYLTIRRRERAVYELIVIEGAARVNYLFRDNEVEFSSIHSEALTIFVLI